MKARDIYIGGMRGGIEYHTFFYGHKIQVHVPTHWLSLALPVFAVGLSLYAVVLAINNISCRG